MTWEMENDTLLPLTDPRAAFEHQTVVHKSEDMLGLERNRKSEIYAWLLALLCLVWGVTRMCYVCFCAHITALYGSIVLGCHCTASSDVLGPPRPSRNQLTPCQTSPDSLLTASSDFLVSLRSASSDLVGSVRSISNTLALPPTAS